MSDFTRLLARNRNYRWTWMGQIVSEMGDHFNNVAVLSLAMDETHSGTAIAAIMLSRDLVRGFLALAFILAIRYHHAWLLYLLSALLMIASPFFTSGRSAILPAIATD